MRHICLHAMQGLPGCSLFGSGSAADRDAGPRLCVAHAAANERGHGS